MNLSKLKEIRTSKHITQQEMADVLCLNKATYSRKEQGIIQFKVNELTLIQNILGLSDKDLFNIFLK